MDYRDYFRSKKITLMGLGLLGRGVGDAKFLAQCVARPLRAGLVLVQAPPLIVTDLKSFKDLASSLKKLRNYKNIKFVLGKHHLADFKNRDLIIKAAGVPLDSPYIAEAKKNKIPVVMSTALFAKLSGAKIIGVTGTRGKTTITHLIYHILKSSGKKVWLGGNVLGVSTLALLPKVKSGDLVVLELDSWQLQGFGDLKISPPIAVFTNFMPDHLNYYHSLMVKYFADKANIYKYQKKDELVFAGRKVAGKIKSPGRKIIPPALPDSWKLNLLGEHNRVNASFAVAVARELDVPDDVIKKTVANFPGVPGRLEFIRAWRGIKIYNDTTATTPAATLAALQALGVPRLAAVGSGQDRNIVLILGGADKNLPLDELVRNLPKYCKAVILLPGTGTENLKLKAKNLKFKEVKNLRKAVSFGLSVAKSDDVLLLSPAFASFGPPPGGFKNEFDRGKKFNQLVKNLA